jgi:hypothetical protein
VQQQAGVATACDAMNQAYGHVTSGPKQFQSVEKYAQAAIAEYRQELPQWQVVGQQAIQVRGRRALQIRATFLAREGQGHLLPVNTAIMADYFFVLGDQCQVIVGVYCPHAAFLQRQAIFQQIIQSLQVR